MVQACGPRVEESHPGLIPWFDMTGGPQSRTKNIEQSGEVVYIFIF